MGKNFSARERGNIVESLVFDFDFVQVTSEVLEWDANLVEMSRNCVKKAILAFGVFTFETETQAKDYLVKIKFNQQKKQMEGITPRELPSLALCKLGQSDLSVAGSLHPVHSITASSSCHLSCENTHTNKRLHVSMCSFSSRAGDSLVKSCFSEGKNLSTFFFVGNQNFLSKFKTL